MLKALAAALAARAGLRGRLRRAGDEVDGTPARPNGRTMLYYVDPMNPAYKSDKPGMAPDWHGARSRSTPMNHGHRRHDRRRDTAIGAARRDQDLARTAAADRREVRHGRTERADARSIRAVGKVTFDETRVAHVHTRIDGWIEKVFVDFTGDFVKQGEPMLTIYSPEMLASQQELLLAARARDLMRDNPLASAAEHGESLFEAAKRRLELWQLKRRPDRAGARRRVSRFTASPLYAPASGFVTERNAFPNQKVTPDSDLYTITDLSRDLDRGRRVRVGHHVDQGRRRGVRACFRTAARRRSRAKVNYIQPQVDPMTRTLKVRLDATNPGLRMKPDMFVNVEFGVAGAKQLVVPAEAVLDTGDRQTVFVDLGNGYLEPRQVVVGERFGDRVAITRGLSAGERVVSSGTFLIDSESQLKAAASGMGAPQHQHGSARRRRASRWTPMPCRPHAPGAHRHD